MISLVAAFMPALAADPVVLSQEVTRIQGEVASMDAERCGAVLQGIFERLAPLRPADVDLQDAVSAGSGILETLFATRVELQGQLKAFHAAGTLSEGCVTGARRYDLATRYLGDHLYLAGVEHDPWLTVEGFSGPDDLQAGDILVTRWKGLSSAGIAHIGKIDSQFSHNAMVHVDADGRKWTVEAYLEKGAVAQPVEDFLHHGLGRIVVIRYEDPALAAKGAALAYERVTTGKPIDYDEAFDVVDNDELFCSEIGPWALSLAGGPRDVPMFVTRYPKDSNPRLFEAMGIPGDVLAAPVDLLYDPRFQILGEWREPELLEPMRRQDVVAETVYTWMEEKDYVLDPVWAQKAFVDVGLTMRRTPLLGRVVADMVHPHGERQFLVTGLALNSSGDIVLEQLNARLAEHEGMATRDEMLAMLEQIRAEDFEIWSKKPKKSAFHKAFHPEET